MRSQRARPPSMASAKRRGDSTGRSCHGYKMAHASLSAPAKEGEMNDEIRPNDPSRPVAGWVFPAALILLLLTLALAVARLAPPSPAPESAPADQFSAGRARAVLADLAGDGAPHPVGSPAQARVRER